MKRATGQRWFAAGVVALACALVLVLPLAAFAVVDSGALGASGMSAASSGSTEPSSGGSSGESPDPDSGTNPSGSSSSSDPEPSGSGESPDPGPDPSGSGESPDPGPEPSGPTVDSVIALIAALPSAADVSGGEYGQLNEIDSQLSQLSAADQATVLAHTGGSASGSDEPYERIIESVEWGLQALNAVDNSTTLEPGRYTQADGFPVSVSGNSGKATWSDGSSFAIDDVVVANGQATGTFKIVGSGAYSRIRLGGMWYGASAVADGAAFTDVPLELNGTFYIVAVSSQANAPIAYQITVSADESWKPDEPEEDDEAEAFEKAKQLIDGLPFDPYDVTQADAGAINAAQAAYDALSAEKQGELDETGKGYAGKTQSYGRTLESAVWALDSLNEVDTSTALAEGEYSTSISSTCSMGKSDSRRGYKFSIVKIIVKDGKAQALIEHDTSTPDTVRLGGKTYKHVNTDEGAHSQFLIPVALNKDMHFSYMAKGATENTVGIACEFRVTIDESTAKPDANSADDDPSGQGDPSGDDNQGGGSEADQEAGSNSSANGSSGKASTNNAAAIAAALGGQAQSKTGAGGDTSKAKVDSAKDKASAAAGKQGANADGTAGAAGGGSVGARGTGAAAMIGLLASVIAGAAGFVACFVWRENRKQRTLVNIP